ncbi:MAG: Unknown protein [uncultured Sulfurovum sp.]|uniref:Uncharacterized protein n=1 Tax=uncultured Sulfurovum sp. TaxID=269237 RepID=A0A6S6T4G3_9BACT|nr:MAG: Unknown protein [uncultured Sulfurovum sp.]
MEYKKFKEVLKKNQLTVKKFSELAGISYATCNTWSNRGAVSAWVESWLNLYIQNKNLKENNSTVSNEEYQELLKLKESLHAVMSGLNTEK